MKLSHQKLLVAEFLQIFLHTIRLRDTVTIPQSYFIVLLAQVFLTY